MKPSHAALKNQPIEIEGHVFTNNIQHRSHKSLITECPGQAQREKLLKLKIITTYQATKKQKQKHTNHAHPALLSRRSTETPSFLPFLFAVLASSRESTPKNGTMHSFSCKSFRTPIPLEVLQRFPGTPSVFRDFFGIGAKIPMPLSGN